MILRFNWSQIGFCLLTVILVFIIYFIINISINYKINNLNPKSRSYNRNKTLLSLVRSASIYFLIISEVIVILIFAGVNVTAIFAGAGLFGIALGFGAQSLVKDFISGIFVLTEQQYEVGDVIEINGFKGEVISLGFKTTVLKNWMGDVFIIGNGSVVSVINHTKENSVAIIHAQVDKSTSIDLVRKLVENELSDVCLANRDIVDKPIFRGVSDLKLNSVEILITVETKPECQYNVERQLRADLLEVFAKNNIKLAMTEIKFRGNKDVAF